MLLPLWCAQAAEYRPQLTTLFGRYVDPCLEHCRRNFKTVVPLPAVNQASHTLDAAAGGAFSLSQILSRHKGSAGRRQCSPECLAEQLACVCCMLQVMTICKILEGILPKESVRGAPPPDKKLLEYHFVFACVWAFGGSMLVDKVGGQSGCCSWVAGCSNKEVFAFAANSHSVGRLS